MSYYIANTHTLEKAPETFGRKKQAQDKFKAMKWPPGMEVVHVDEYLRLLKL